MTDQNQPKLSLEEELDVLEAVYKIGKEKGLELLRPEQMKKLEDAGRMGESKGSKSPEKRNGKMIGFWVDKLIEGLLFDSEFEGKKLYRDGEWEQMGQAEVKKIGFSMFVSTYGFSPETMRAELLRRIMKDRLYG